MSDPTGQWIHTGVPNTLAVLWGGSIPKSETLLGESSGAAKTIFGRQFLCADTQSPLYISLGEPNEYLETTATQFGLDASHVECLDVSPAGQFQSNQSDDLFETVEIEPTEVVARIRETVETNKLDRVLVDPTAGLRTAIGVLNPRTSGFATSLRRSRIFDEGRVVAEPLSALGGILTSTPDWDDD